jgi:hypothetical protein
MRKVFAKGLIAAVFLLMVVSVSAQSTGDLVSAKGKWKVYTFNASHAHLSSKIATAVPGTGVTFNFPSTPDTAYLLTSPGSSWADLTGKTLSAGIQVTGSGALFAYNGCSTPTVRFFFQTAATGAFDPTNYWWSVPGTGSSALTGPLSPTTLTTALDPSLWSDYNGQRADSSAAVTAAFDIALQNMASIGLSYGGCGGYANGVGVPTGGPDSFILSTFTIQ